MICFLFGFGFVDVAVVLFISVYYFFYLVLFYCVFFFNKYIKRKLLCD